MDKEALKTKREVTEGQGQGVCHKGAEGEGGRYLLGMSYLKLHVHSHAPENWSCLSLSNSMSAADSELSSTSEV